MADDPFQVVNAPNYAMPLIDFSALSGQKKPVQPPQQQPPLTPQQQQLLAQQQQASAAQNLGTAIPNFAQGFQKFMNGPGQQQPNAMGLPGQAPAPNQLTGLW